MFRLLTLLACGTLALAQQYTISTAAGGAPPATPAPAGSIGIGLVGRVAVDPAGNVYLSAGHSVYRINSGNLVLVAGNARAGFSGDGGPAVNAQLNSPEGLAIDSAGNLYIADSVNNRVRIVTPDGLINTFAGTGAVSPGGPNTYNDNGPATNALLHLPMGVAADKSGNVYIADTGDNMIRKVTPDGTITAFAGDSYPSYGGDGGNAVNAELNKPGDVAVDSSGNIYIADSSNNVIRKVTTDGLIGTIAGTGAAGWSGDNAEATKAVMTAPLSLAVDGSGNIYIAENGDSRIRKIDSKGIITTIAGTGAAGFSGDNGAPDKAQLNSPTGIAVDGSGNVYIADSLNLRIRKIAGSTISSIAGNGGLSYSGDNGPALAAQLYTPQGVAVDAAGNIYVSDTGNNVVRRVSTDGIIRNFAGNGSAGFGGDNGAATSAQLSGPMGLAVDAAGNVYIADSGNSRVRRVNPDGTISTVAGNGTPGFGGDNGAAASAQLYSPSGVAVDPAGNLYIADFANSRVRKVAADGTITTIAGIGTTGYSGDGGPATSARLSLPQGVAADAAGNVYIADTGNHAVRRVSTAGTITTFAGSGLPGFSGDGGPATRAELGNPFAVAVDSAGNVYVSDGTRIRKVLPSGFIITIAGNGNPGYSGDGGAATDAQLNGAAAVALDAAGNLYIADRGNNAVRVLQPHATGTMTVSAVTDAASYQAGTIAPGEVVVVWGTGLGPSGIIGFTLNASGLVPTSLAGTTVFFNDAPAPLLYTSSNQVSAIVPFGISGSRAQVVVQYGGQVSTPLPVNVAATAPSIFTAKGSGSGQAAAVNQNGSLNDAAHPAKPGDIVSLYATGLGQTNPNGQDGKPSAIPLPLPVADVTAGMGGKAATVQYAGGAPGIVAGVMQVNVVVPDGVTGVVPVSIQSGGVSSQKDVTIAVQ